MQNSDTFLAHSNNRTPRSIPSGGKLKHGMGATVKGNFTTQTGTQYRKQNLNRIPEHKGKTKIYSCSLKDWNKTTEQ